MGDKIMKLGQQHVGKLQDQAGCRAVFSQCVQAAGRYDHQLVFCERICFISKGDSHIVGQRRNDFHKTMPMHRKM